MDARVLLAGPPAPPAPPPKSSIVTQALGTAFTTPVWRMSVRLSSI
jgi:hypothetical protein